MYRNKPAWGLLEGENVLVLKEPPFRKISLTSKKLNLKKIKLLPPSEPTKIILVGLNYKDHAKELKMPLPNAPLIFLKPLTALIGHNEKIIYPTSVRQLDYEAELAIVVGRVAKNISVKEAFKYIFGYTCLNDITARDLQRKDIQWTRAKSFDTFCPLGPWIETQVKPNNLNICSYLNGKMRQNSNTAEFIFSPGCLVSFISKVMTLMPGDIISTGTPSGIGSMKKGDTVEVEIEGIGKLTSHIA